MGVQHLHRLLEPAWTLQRCADAPKLARSFGVNAVDWVHTQDEDGVVPHLLRCIEPFRVTGVSLHVVFDGTTPSAKAVHEKSKFTIEDKVLMRQQLEQVLRADQSFRYIHAHTACYEADSQLVALAAAGTIDAIVAQDSDLIVRLALAKCVHTLVLFDWSKRFKAQCKVLSVQDVFDKQPALSSAAHLLFAAVALGCDYSGSGLRGFDVTSMRPHELQRRGILQELERADLSLPQRVTRAVEAWHRSAAKPAETEAKDAEDEQESDQEKEGEGRVQWEGKEESGREEVQGEKQAIARSGIDDGDAALVINEYLYQPVYGIDGEIAPMTPGEGSYNEAPASVIEKSDKLAALLRDVKPLGPELDWMVRVPDPEKVAAMRKRIEERLQKEGEKEPEEELVGDAKLFAQMHELIASDW